MPVIEEREILCKAQSTLLKKGPSGMFRVFTKSHFSAAHFIKGHGGVCEKLHGHNWIVKVTACMENLDDLGMVIDFKILKMHLKKILSILDHENLNELDEFKGINPTAEQIAKYIFTHLQESLQADYKDTHKIITVEVNETPGSGASYSID